MADQVFSVSAGFFDSVNHDRLYTAEQMIYPYNRIVGDGVFKANDGADADLKVEPYSGLKIRVDAGQAMIASRWFKLATFQLIEVPANTSANGRIDSVIVQIDARQSGRSGSVIYRTGTPSASPVPPALVTISGVTEYRVADIAVASGASAISAGDITDYRGTSTFPWVASLISGGGGGGASVTTKRNSYTTVSSEVSISIGIGGFDKASDTLLVFINGMYATPGTYYSINNGSTSITLVNALPAGNRVDFVAIMGATPA